MLSWIRRAIIVWTFEVLTLFLLSKLLPGIELDSAISVLILILVISFQNALLRPILVKLTLPITVLSLGFWSLIINSLVVFFAGYIVPGISIHGFITPLIITLSLSTVNTLICNLLSLDDENPFYRNIIKQYLEISNSDMEKNIDGLIIIEIDGLSYASIKTTMDKGLMPNLSDCLKKNTHKIIQWDCGIQSQTSSSQAGILFGNNYNIPAFRWFEKKEHKLFISNNPKDAAEIEHRINTNQGLLSKSGSSFGNMFSGNAKKNILTLSKANHLDKGLRKSSKYYFSYFINPYSFSRALTLMTWEIIVHWWEALIKLIKNIKPRIHQGFLFPIERAASTVLMRDIAIYTIIEDMFSGIKINYSSFTGYDVVAHHFGVESSAAFRILRILDNNILKLFKISKKTGNNYKFLILSDHGQSQGETFSQRYGITLQELVKNYTKDKINFFASIKPYESKGHLKTILTEALKAGSKIENKRKNKLYKNQETRKKRTTIENAEVVVCTSGNLALIYFLDYSERLSFEYISEHYPGIIEGLASHVGIGFVLVHSEKHGALVVGKEGIHYLDKNIIQGEDPLKLFGKYAYDQIKRIDKFDNIGDITVNSFYDPKKNEVAAFEELVGSHGGLGGAQNKPFLIYPSDFKLNEKEIIGSENIYNILKKWLGDL